MTRKDLNSEYLPEFSEHDVESATDEESTHRGDSSRSMPLDSNNSIAAKESKQVFYSRILLLLVVFLSVILLGYLTFSNARDAEQDAFESQFDNDASEILELSNTAGYSITNVLAMISGMIRNSAKRDNATFPNYTFPDFELLAETSHELSGAVDIIFAPLVENKDRTVWESYSIANQHLVTKDVHNKDEIPGFIHTCETMTESITPVQNLDRYAPVWQLSPPPSGSSVFNLDLLSFPEIQQVVQFLSPYFIVGTTGILDSDFFAYLDRSSDTDDAHHNHQHNHVEHPQSLVIVPVFEDLEDDNSPIVGYVMAIMSWYKIFEDVLSKTSATMFAVLEESCGHTFTYSFDHDTATLKEESGDQHRQKYDYLEKSRVFISYPDDIPELNDLCEYKIRLYPDADFEGHFKSNRPIRASLSVVGVFVWISAVFLFYDFLVRRRQAKVNNVATKSNAIIASLFPVQVREKLIMSQMERSERQLLSGNASLLAARFAPDSRNSWTNDWISKSSGTEKESDAPIADLFPSATVVFMDIEGFTAWSSQREPSQVFVLLETIYRAFDKIAQKRKVFKVETIGDCYVAGELFVPYFTIA